jgi:hypothetical protein
VFDALLLINLAVKTIKSTPIMALVILAVSPANPREYHEPSTAI